MDWLLIVLGVILFGLLVLAALKLVWNLRLNNFQRRNGVAHFKKHQFVIGKNLVSLTILLVLSILTITSGVTVYFNSTPNSINFDSKEVAGITYENAKKVESKEEFLKLINNVYKNSNLKDYSLGMIIDNSFNFDAKGTQDQSVEKDGSPNITDTYNQVVGVTEADIAKVSPDGTYLVYGAEYSNKIYYIELNSDGSHKGIFKEKDLGAFYFHEMLLYEDKLILIGAKAVTQLNNDLLMSETYKYYFNLYSAFYILDANSLDVIHETTFYGRITETRLVENMLYIVSSNYLGQFVKNDKENALPDLQNTYYFKGDSNINEVTKVISIDLSSDELLSNDISFFGSNSGFYMGNDKIVLVNYKWRFYSDNTKGYNTSTIIVVNYDELGKFTYVGSYEVDGIIRNQYHIDVYQDQIRVVTTQGLNNRNALFIFNVDPKSDQLKVIGSLTEGLGKPNETVKSVTYQENIVKVVTFLQVDPLYTIDLTDPTKPVIIGVIEEPGFSSVLFVWDDAGNTIGIGYMANQMGIAIGIKVSAYKTGDTEPTQTIEFPYHGYFGSRYITANALNNPRKHLLLNKELGIFGFIASGFNSDDITGIASKTLIFNVDFTNLETPIIMHEIEEVDFRSNIEKMVMINDNLHILSKTGVYSYNFSSKSFDEFISFNKHNQ